MARNDELLARALLESRLKVGPQVSALRGLLEDLAGQYTQTRRVNASNERAIRSAVSQASPAMGSAFDQALQSVQAQAGAVGATDDAQARAYQRRVGEARAGALNDLTERGMRATEGRVYANEKARMDYFGGTRKIQGQLRSVLAEQGALTASTLGQLEEREAQRAAGRAQRREARRHNIAQEQTAARNAQTAAQRAAQAGRAKQPPRWLGQKEHSQAKDEIERAIAHAKDALTDARGSRAAAIQQLMEGAPPVKDDDGNVIDPGYKPIAGDFARAALNLVADGSLSRSDLARLHNRGLRIKLLGYRVRRPARPFVNQGRSNTRAPSSNYQHGPARRGAGR